MRPLDSNRPVTDFYRDQTIKDYFGKFNLDENAEIFTGLQFYENLMAMLLGSNAERKLIAEYQAFISKNLFEGQTVTLIPSINSKVVEIKIGKEKERPIYSLGDGLQMAIIMSFLPYIKNERTFFFIEEPEVHLHPGMQRKIIEFFASLDQHTFFLTTHSNHLLDITLDIRNATVFTFRKQFDGEDDDQSATYTVENVDGGHESSLELLGVRNSSVFLVNATIWVEGITDRLYLRQYLKMYVKTLDNKTQRIFEEDTHYSFVEYGGSNITHWSFLTKEEHPIEVKSLCARAYVVIDNDGVGSKEKRKRELQEKLKDHLCILDAREIENTLPAQVIKSIVQHHEGHGISLNPFEFENYQYEYLGTFIESSVLQSDPVRTGGYGVNLDETTGKRVGTIKGKVGFCNQAIEYLENLEFKDLPEPTQNSVKKIYAFILEQNIQ